MSDEFLVPLCSIHHYQIQVTGDEREWWLRQKLDPLQVAKRLWINGPKNLRLDSAYRKGQMALEAMSEVGFTNDFTASEQSGSPALRGHVRKAIPPELL